MKEESYTQNIIKCYGLVKKKKNIKLKPIKSNLLSGLQ